MANQFTQAWTKIQEEQLTLLFEQGATKKEMAILLNRTENSIKTRLSKKLKLTKSNHLSLEHIEKTKDLIKRGYNITQIAKILKVKACSLSQLCNRHGYNPWADYRTLFAPRSDTARKNIAKKLLPKECEICGFNRLLELAHIVPSKYKGPLEAWNLLALCPNHHRLFDYNKLTLEEFSKIKSRVEKAKETMLPMLDLENIKETLKKKGVEYPERLKDQISMLFLNEKNKRVA